MLLDFRRPDPPAPGDRIQSWSPIKSILRNNRPIGKIKMKVITFQQLDDAIIGSRPAIVLAKLYG
jgi:hypothetical protein